MRRSLIIIINNNTIKNTYHNERTIMTTRTMTVSARSTQSQSRSQSFITFNKLMRTKKRSGKTDFQFIKCASFSSSSSSSSAEKREQKNANNNNNNDNDNDKISNKISNKIKFSSQTQTQKTKFNGDVIKTQKEKQRENAVGIRLSKALQALGVSSRRHSEDIIFEGRVKVNGMKIIEPQFKVVLDNDVIELDNKVVQGGVEYAGEHFYFLVNKPKGYVCSTVSEQGLQGKKALDLLQTWTEQWRKANPGKLPPRLFTVGRLDVQTTGMLLVTTDGNWSQRVAHPSSEVTKRYIITSSEKVTTSQIAKMRKGTEVDGVHVTPKLVEAISGDGGPKNRIAVEVEDGRNREVRRIAEAAQVEVKNLKRVSIGGLNMPSELPTGMFCSLKPNQVAYVLEKSLQISGGKF